MTRSPLPCLRAQPIRRPSMHSPWEATAQEAMGPLPAESWTQEPLSHTRPFSNLSTIYPSNFQHSRHPSSFQTSTPSASSSSPHLVPSNRLVTGPGTSTAPAPAPAPAPGTEQQGEKAVPPLCAGNAAHGLTDTPPPGPSLPSPAPLAEVSAGHHWSSRREEPGQPPDHCSPQQCPQYRVGAP